MSQTIALPRNTWSLLEDGLQKLQRQIASAKKHLPTKGTGSKLAARMSLRVGDLLKLLHGVVPQTDDPMSECETLEDLAHFIQNILDPEIRDRLLETSLFDLTDRHPKLKAIRIIGRKTTNTFEEFSVLGTKRTTVKDLLGGLQKFSKLRNSGPGVKDHVKKFLEAEIRRLHSEG